MDERLIPEPFDFTEEEREFDSFLRSILIEEEMLLLRDVLFGIKPSEPITLSEAAKRRIMECVLARIFSTKGK
jgi:hypothetical protein